MIIEKIKICEFRPGGGFGGGMMGGNMQQLMKQAQKMQEQMKAQAEEADAKLEEARLTAAAGGGAVTVEVNGHKKVISVKIKPAAVDPEDVEMLEDLIIAAMNEALAKAEALASELKPNLGM